ncbi:MAG: 50S ribosomal protein L29 [Tychonema bourrellyi B0820]|jgi:large subunit ribosomal protein L29|uniref:Large ribosomal subunit protein uL29 n=1 Tax=Tychonema bourrellyi FEM_GT703 TaxID=2040638 RepID=A0A2G4F5X9_9CYAN|nr:50S ribosomal protein L29 [Tychonema bourrellyi]MDQ2099697.1 50S ribosomal protein L29 [Tychonema bourrellyi B0820]PHX57149.1 50S ribosomal protein L29 [Tychonema bourrellyi FEM_GT703]
MSLPKIKESRDLNDAEVAEQILAVKRQLMELRLFQATGRMDKPHLFKHAKHRLAQLMTVERERQRVAEAAAVAEKLAQSIETEQTASTAAVS